MRKLFISGGLFAACALGMPTAHGDQGAFIREIKAAGIVVSDEGAVKNAELTCKWFGMGMSARDVATHMSTGSGLDMTHTVIFTTLAVKEFCPQYLVPGTQTPQQRGPVGGEQVV